MMGYYLLQRCRDEVVSNSNTITVFINNFIMGISEQFKNENEAYLVFPLTIVYPYKLGFSNLGPKLWESLFSFLRELTLCPCTYLFTFGRGTVFDNARYRVHACFWI